jgi:hypothetical protein
MLLSQFVEQYVANGAELSEWRHAERLEASWTGGFSGLCKRVHIALTAYNCSSALVQ